MLGALLASVATSGVLGAAPASIPPPTAAVSAIAIERTVPAVPPTRIGTATAVADRPVAPVGDPAVAVDADAVIAIADVADVEPAESVIDPSEWFLVGDSTFLAAADHIGFGSAIPGVGFELAPFVGRLNPLRDAPRNFSGTVVIGISIWDVGIDDATAYVRAVRQYRSAGHPVLVVAVPERYGPVGAVRTTAAEEADLRAFNDLVAASIECPVAPWSVRDVESLGDVDGGDDHVHPTATGVMELLANLAAVVDQACPPEA